MSALLDLPTQLSFDVGQNRTVKPAGASIQIGGKATLHTQLLLDDEIGIQLINSSGEVIGRLDGACVDIVFKKHDATETSVAWIERIHKIKLDANED